MNLPDTQPRQSFRSFLRAFQQGCVRHGCHGFYEQPGETDLKLELCPECMEPMISSPEEWFHWCEQGLGQISNEQ